MVPLRWIVALGVLGVVFLGAIAVAFQDNITRFNLKPRVPYQIYTPPPPPNYGARGAWALWPSSQQEKEEGEVGVDVFYIHSTTYSSRKHWNAPIAMDRADKTLRDVAAPNQAGPFMNVGDLYGPRYRQATLFASFTHKYDGIAAHELAYQDIKKSFEHFLKIRNPDNAIILTGYEQGGLHALGLLQEYFAKDDMLRKHLVAAYVINAPTPLSLFDNALKTIPPCRTAADIRCVVAYIDIQPGFDDEEDRFTKRSLIWEENGALESVTQTPLLCVNPLSWSVSDELIDAEKHIGAASATGLRMSETPPAIAHVTSAQCKNGLLLVDAPSQSFLKRRRWFGDHWRPQDFNLFYHDLAADAVRRSFNLEAVLHEEARFLAPIEEAVDLEVSPVNKVPN
ncbi:MAG: hypothetical protein DHS20C05_08090 [Hyphococcus sp.]|nr:MAG: hypothetical protein DHS20C05_08090 [Marinicaulis sp.]